MTVRSERHDQHSDYELGQLALIRRGGICAFGLRVDLHPLKCLSILCVAIAMSALGHSRPNHSALVPINVRFCPIATKMVRRGE